MDNIEFIWYESPAIWAAIISGCFALLSGLIAILLFNKKNNIIAKLDKELETHKSELGRKNIEIQTALNIQLEKVRIQYGITHTRRLDVFYEACERMSKTDNHIVQLASYHTYDCKGNIDFSDKSKREEHSCDKNCIVNYYDRLIDFKRHYKETSDFFHNNEMFFSLETVIAHLKFINAMSELAIKTIDVARDLERTENERAIACFKLFYDFDRTTLIDIRSDLVSQYRTLIGIPESIRF